MERKGNQIFFGFGAVVGITVDFTDHTQAISVLGLDHKVYECEPRLCSSIVGDPPNIGNIVVVTRRFDGKYDFERQCTPDESSAFLALMSK